MASLASIQTPSIITSTVPSSASPLKDTRLSLLRELRGQVFATRDILLEEISILNEAVLEAIAYLSHLRSNANPVRQPSTLEPIQNLRKQISIGEKFAAAQENITITIKLIDQLNGDLAESLSKVKDKKLPTTHPDSITFFKNTLSLNSALERLNRYTAEGSALIESLAPEDVRDSKTWLENKRATLSKYEKILKDDELRTLESENRIEKLRFLKKELEKKVDNYTIELELLDNEIDRLYSALLKGPVDHFKWIRDEIALTQEELDTITNSPTTILESKSSLKALDLNREKINAHCAELTTAQKQQEKTLASLKELMSLKQKHTLLSDSVVEMKSLLPEVQEALDRKKEAEDRKSRQPLTAREINSLDCTIDSADIIINTAVDVLRDKKPDERTELENKILDHRTQINRLKKDIEKQHKALSSKIAFKFNISLEGISGAIGAVETEGSDLMEKMRAQNARKADLSTHKQQISLKFEKALRLQLYAGSRRQAFLATKLSELQQELTDERIG